MLARSMMTIEGNINGFRSEYEYNEDSNES